MKVKSIAIMALLGLISAEEIPKSIGAKMREIQDRTLLQEDPVLVDDPAAAALAKAKTGAQPAAAPAAAPVTKNATTAANATAAANSTAAANATAAVNATAKAPYQQKPLHHWGANVPYSDQLSNGDVDDDKEVEDEDDPHDLIVDDNGFTNQKPRSVVQT